MAMMNFDQTLFASTYNNLLSEKSFKEIFYDVFIPLMNEIGFLWQTDTITPAHEHFLSYLVKQKLLINTEKLQLVAPTKTDKIFVLYLPMNEIHELGLMYLNYEIISKGYKTIYLGESVPTENLKSLKNYFDNIVFVCYATVEPNASEIHQYIKTIEDEVLEESSSLWILGKTLEDVDVKKFSSKTTVFNSIANLVDNI